MVTYRFMCPALLHGCCEANQHIKKSTILEQMYNVKDWLQGSAIPIHNHSNPHIFKFVMDEHGSSRMFYKHWNHSQWEPAGEAGLLLLKV